MFRRLDKGSEDLIKANVVLKDLEGGIYEEEGVLNVELTIRSKVIPTSFLVISGKRLYNLFLIRDWINVNYCIPSRMHQMLIQWKGNRLYNLFLIRDCKVDIVLVDTTVNVATTDLHLWLLDTMRCLSDRCCNRQSLKATNQVVENVGKGGPELYF
jgi:hypothetical protein